MAMTKEQISAFRASLGDIATAFDDATIEKLAAAAAEKLAGDKAGNKAIRDAKTKLAKDRKANNAKMVAELCAELGVEVPGIVKSIHRTDKVVKDKETNTEKVPQVLTGLKLTIGGLSFSLDAYVATGKGARVTPEVEEKVKEAQALCMNLAVAIAEAGYVNGEQETEGDDTASDD